MLLYLGALLAGIGVIWKAGDVFVGSARKIAVCLGVSQAFIALTLIAFATSAPEFFTSLIAAALGNYGISFGNVVGSNIINIGLILAISAVFGAARVNPGARADACVLVILSGILVVFALDGVLMPLEGLLLLLFFSFFLIATCRKERQAVAPEEAAGSLKRLLVLFAFAAVGLFVGARLLVFGGAGLAREALVSAGLSPLEAEAAVGFTVVALGTSLPELATILISIKRRFYEISLGTVIGSNIFNIGLIAGTASIATAAVGGALLVDEQAIRLGNPAMIALSALLAVFTVNRKSLARWQGAVLMLLYISYMGLMGAFYSL